MECVREGRDEDGQEVEAHLSKELEDQGLGRERADEKLGTSLKEDS